MHSLGGLGRQAGEVVRHVGLGIDGFTVAVAHQRVEDGTALACLCIAYKEPVFLADGGGAERVFHRVVVDLHATVLRIHLQHGPGRQSIVQGTAKSTFG